MRIYLCLLVLARISTRIMLPIRQTENLSKVFHSRDGTCVSYMANYTKPTLHIFAQHWLLIRELL